MKNGWGTQKLDGMLEIQNGCAFDSKAFSPTKGMPLIRIRDLKGGAETETRFDGEYDQKYVVKAGDLLVGMDGEFGCYQWKGDPALLNQRVCRLQGFSDELMPRFLFYGVNRYLKEIEDVTGYATVKHLSSKQILEIDFPHPPISEQRRIVGILDEAFAAIATAKQNAEKNLQNARALFESHLNAVFTERGTEWTEASFEDVVADDCTLSYGIVQPGDEEPNGLPVVRPTDLVAKMIPLDGLKRIDPKRAKAYGRTVLQGGELLMCVRGTTGVISVAAPELKGANVTRGIVPVRFNSVRIDSTFGYYALISDPVQRQIRLKTYGAALMQINIGDLRKLTIAFPRVAQQRIIADRLDVLDTETQRLESIYQRKLAALDELKKSLLHQAFSGQL